MSLASLRAWGHSDSPSDRKVALLMQDGTPAIVWLDVHAEAVLLTERQVHVPCRCTLLLKA